MRITIVFRSYFLSVINKIIIYKLSLKILEDETDLCNVFRKSFKRGLADWLINYDFTHV